jgi:di/tricarboxylate transporter
MTFEILFVLLALLGMVIALVLDKMRPGMVLFSVVVLFLCAGILTPKEMLEGFSNKGMMTVAMLAVGCFGASNQEAASPR